MNTTDQRRTVWGHSEKVAICKPRREATAGDKPADTLEFGIIHFWPPELTDQFL